MHSNPLVPHMIEAGTLDCLTYLTYMKQRLSRYNRESERFTVEKKASRTRGKAMLVVDCSGWAF